MCLARRRHRHAVRRHGETAMNAVCHIHAGCPTSSSRAVPWAGKLAARRSGQETTRVPTRTDQIHGDALDTCSSMAGPLIPRTAAGRRAGGEQGQTATRAGGHAGLLGDGGPGAPHAARTGRSGAGSHTVPAPGRGREDPIITLSSHLTGAEQFFTATFSEFIPKLPLPRRDSQQPVSYAPHQSDLGAKPRAWRDLQAARRLRRRGSHI